MVVYEFHGGPLNGKRLCREYAEAFCINHTRDRSNDRARGILCQRAELDNQPVVPGYIGPMWDGYRLTDENGVERYEFEVRDEETKKRMRRTAVLRYETQEVYNELSN